MHFLLHFPCESFSLNTISTTGIRKFYRAVAKFVCTYVCVFGEIVIISHVLTSVGPYFYHLFKVSEIIEDLHTCTLYLQTFE